jgi:hypothetical protein
MFDVLDDFGRYDVLSFRAAPQVSQAHSMESSARRLGLCLLVLREKIRSSDNAADRLTTTFLTEVSVTVVGRTSVRAGTMSTYPNAFVRPTLVHNLRSERVRLVAGSISELTWFLSRPRELKTRQSTWRTESRNARAVNVLDGHQILLDLAAGRSLDLVNGLDPSRDQQVQRMSSQTNTFSVLWSVSKGVSKACGTLTS